MLWNQNDLFFFLSENLPPNFLAHFYSTVKGFQTATHEQGFHQSIADQAFLPIPIKSGSHNIVLV